MIFYLIAVNLLSFFLIKMDKDRARKGQWRVPEKKIWWLTFAGGALGVYGGMKLFRHKTKHKNFVYGVPFILLLQIVLLGYWLLQSGL